MFEQCCGNCKWADLSWWDGAENDEPPFIGECKFPHSRLPYALTAGSCFMSLVTSSDGKNCICFEHPDELGLLRR